MLAKPEVEEQAELDWMVWCSASESLGELLKNADALGTPPSDSYSI